MIASFGRNKGLKTWTYHMSAPLSNLLQWPKPFGNNFKSPNPAVYDPQRSIKPFVKRQFDSRLSHRNYRYAKLSCSQSGCQSKAEQRPV